jgi:hypothetical protein
MTGKIIGVVCGEVSSRGDSQINQVNNRTQAPRFPNGIRHVSIGD